MDNIIDQIRDMEAAPNPCPICGEQWGPCPCDLEVDEAFSALVDPDRCCANDDTRSVAMSGEFCWCSRCRVGFGLDDEPAIPFE